MRKPFDTTCDIYKGPGTATPGLLVGTFPCRYVREDGIFAIGQGHIPIPAYMTIEGYEPVGLWTPVFLGIDPSLSDQIAIPSGVPPRWWVIYTDVIVWHAQAPYYRGYLAYLPLPAEPLAGGIVLNGSAVPTFNPPFTGAGGIVLNGSAVPTFNPPFVSIGGIVLSGTADNQTTRKRFITPDGGVLLNGSAPPTFTPGSTDYVRDTFTDANGTPLTSHTPEVGGPWLSIDGSFDIQGNILYATSYLSNGAHARIDAGHTSYTLTAAVLIQATIGNDIAGILFRCLDRGNSWYGYIYASTLYLDCYSGGSLVDQHTVTPGGAGIQGNIRYTLTLVVTPTNATLSISGGGISGSVSSSATYFASVTYVGVTLYNFAGLFVGNYVDDLLVVP